MKNADNMKLANKCAELIDKYRPDAVCIDGGNGSGVIDRLREMGYKVHEVGFGTTQTTNSMQIEEQKFGRDERLA